MLRRASLQFVVFSSSAVTAVGRMILLACTALFLGACATGPKWAFDVRDVPPLKLDGQIYTYDQEGSLADDPEILMVTEEMRDFVELYTGESNNAHNKLMALHRAIKGQGALAMQYDPFADGTARDAFERGTANCLSYAHMFTALAREAGLNAQYQWMEVRPEWHRMGDRVAVRLHVNVQVKMRDTTEYMVDIDPLNRNEVAGARLMSDAEGFALYYNNRAMNALAVDRPVIAWQQLVRGLEEAPGLSQLWVNLGAIYRYAGQYAEAEQAYFHALEIDGSDRSAMNNLVVLYELQGRGKEQHYWEDRLERYRSLNPYYHASLGDVAMEEKDWEQAYEHFARATKMQPDDGLLIYSQGLAAHELGNDEEAERLISQAIERASFQVEKQRYRVQLKIIREQQAAAL
ncbi:transglutaminase domain-containing protein [Congregibacter brevis]|uniref:Transglutaminase domain-containing protein n=1 Tax=Congregibacter brevis TaxID=3081201 RepID=A0ABZ0IE66_9GAMM|nr:transglutaminase domain-containing protein [Congregibacter sp. IMCC45268]